MNLKIASLPNAISPEIQRAQPRVADEKGGDFAQMLMDVLKDVNAAQQDARAKQNAFMTNQPVEIHDLKIAMERANTAMLLTLQVRNKLLDAYQEIMRMQV